ncbi:hypothetical protein [Streptomyces sp. HGB0020]|uniref:hypothetical protein n=1 Tax=Streptomyces sp. HGB0020 TaxID=1078086 RepID=UPI00034E3609|nr:hypothetical protein [Streptomyces sp. HGB0020]EPD63144.1 hypothetical protein HMPREF1211_03485 [Streptomyces sp. HGB0020]
MSAIDETTAAATVGKSTLGGSQLPVGDATRRLFMVPQLDYADAVHAELLTVAMPPACYEAGIRRSVAAKPELYIRATWLVGSPLLDDKVRGLGLVIGWSHKSGWAAHDIEDNSQLFNVDVLADPRLIAYAALHLAEEPLTGEPWTPPEDLDPDRRWSEAVYTDIALGKFDLREGLL